MLNAPPSPTFDSGTVTLPALTESVVVVVVGALGTGSEPSGCIAELGSGATVTLTRLRAYGSATVTDALTAASLGAWKFGHVMFCMAELCQARGGGPHSSCRPTSTWTCLAESVLVARAVMFVPEPEVARRSPVICE